VPVTEKHTPQPYDNVTLEDIGVLLREERERAGLTKTDVSSRTKITIEEINHLEEGRAPKIASVYARGFLRTYCELLKLKDSAGVIRAYRRLTANQNDDFDKPLTSKYMEKDYQDESPSNAWSFLIVTLALLVLVAGAAYVSPNVRQKVYGILPESALALLPDLEAARPGQGGPSPVLAEEPERAPAATTEEPEPFHGRLTLRAERTTWAQVTVDDEPVAHILFEPGQTQSFEGLNSLNVIAGDGQALRMEWNGQDRGFLGREGPVEVFFSLSES
jgi:transcriptional regulator with XRE-family HTH domain